MKKVLTSTFKVLFWAYFMYCTGIVQGIVSTKTNPDSNLYSDVIVPKGYSFEERLDYERQMFQLYDQQVAAAKKKVKSGGIYSIYDYFTDMKIINDFRKKYGVELYPQYFELQEYSRKSDFSEEDLSRARDIAYPGSYAKDLENKKNPTNWGDIGSDIGMWALALYLKMLPCVLFLFLIWLYEQNGRKKVRIRNPLSFIISLLFHPIVIFLAIREWWEQTGRSFVGSIEVRRIKDRAFSLLTRDETALIQEFAKRHITYKEFKIKLHGDSPLYRRSIMLALMMTLVMYCVPRSATLRVVSKDERTEIYNMTTAYDHFSKDCLGQSMDELGSKGIGLFIIPDPAISLYQQSTRIKRLYRSLTSYLLPRGHIRSVEHVPLMINIFFMQVKQFVNLNSKIYENFQSAYSAFPYGYKFYCSFADQEHCCYC